MNAQRPLCLASLWLTLIAGGFTSAVHSADAETATENEAAAQQQESQDAERTQPDTAKSSAAESKGTSDGSVFIPSEEISEDFAVSFPVDI